MENVVRVSDRVDVVRCRECRHWEKELPDLSLRGGVRKCSALGRITKHDMFCWYGERREKENEAASAD